jgi:hypothetical protein
MVNFRNYRPVRIKKLPAITLVSCWLEELNILSFNIRYFIRQFFYCYKHRKEFVLFNNSVLPAAYRKFRFLVKMC